MKLVSFKSLAPALLLISTAVWADYHDDVGYRTLEDHNQLISQGANLKVGQVEAKIDLHFFPDPSSGEFVGKAFLCSAPTDPSVHATTVGTEIYGSQDGLAPDTHSICVLDSDSFLGDRGLRVGQRNKAPAKLGLSVINNSWIAAYTADQYNIEATRRLDWMIQRDDVLAVSSVDNGAGSAFPKLLASAYNGIAVGILDGSSGGPIRFDSRGARVKPDLVVPMQQTSYATGVVSGAAALLRSEAKARSMAVNELTTKALLMAGAERPADWQRGAPGTQDDEKVPLDYRYGAGSLRVDQSYEILMSGRHASGGSDTGWDAGLAKKKSKVYQFTTVDSTVGDDLEPFTAVLAWNRDIKRGAHGAIVASLADLEMNLMVKSGRKWKKVARSDSDFDNVETITLNDLNAGTYRLVVRGDRPEPYSIAWFRNRDDEEHGGGSNSGPGSTSSIIGPTVMSGPMPPTAAPEPGTMLLALAAMGMIGMRRRR
jgi:hypothetical protein